MYEDENQRIKEDKIKQLQKDKVVALEKYFRKVRKDFPKSDDIKVRFLYIFT